MQAARCIEGAQHQQQSAPPLHPQGHQAQGEVDGHVLAAIQVEAFLLQASGRIGPYAQPPVLAHLQTWDNDSEAIQVLIAACQAPCCPRLETSAYLLSLYLSTSPSR